MKLISACESYLLYEISTSLLSKYEFNDLDSEI